MRRERTIHGRNTVHETVAGETLVIHLKTGSYFSLMGSGSEIWNLLGASSSVPQICAELARRHDCREEDIRAQVEDFVAELEREELIEPSDEGSDAPTPAREVSPNPAGGPWAPPCLERYDDLRDFLLVDPIHEVDERGWPSEKAPQ